jgi:hypothetical protein
MNESCVEAFSFDLKGFQSTTFLMALQRTTMIAPLKSDQEFNKAIPPTEVDATTATTV